KATIEALLGAERAIGVELTPSMAMLPAASVAELYVAHPDARYFDVGKIGRDQVDDVTRRTDVDVTEVERWLAPVLGYEPEVSTARCPRVSGPPAGLPATPARRRGWA